MTEQNISTQDEPIVARAGTYYRFARYAIALLFLGYGGWCIRDGFFVYPRMNWEARVKGQDEPHGPPKATWDVPFNIALGTTLPVLAVIMIIWTLHNSRGEFRLEGEMLTVPGQPPFSLDAIRKVDKRLWDKKGIAYIDFEKPNGETAQFRLDDFIYQRDPTDAILARIEAHARKLAESAEPAPAEQPSDGSDGGQ